MRLSAAALIVAPLMTGCGTVAGYESTETVKTICDELNRVLPTWAESDSSESKDEGDRFLTVFESVCMEKHT